MARYEDTMRIVSLCPSTTELLFQLGCGADVVGITKFCEHPAGRVEHLPKVGGTKDPDIARIVELQPDLVLLNREENRLEDANALEESGLRIHASLPLTVPQTATCVRELGSLLGVEEAADALADRILEREAWARERARRRPQLAIAYLIWKDPWMAAGAMTYVDGLLATVGGSNVFLAGEGRYPVFTPADLTARAPDLVLLSSEPFPFKSKHARWLAEATGLPFERMLLVDGQRFCWHGSRTLAGLEYADGIMERAV